MLQQFIKLYILIPITLLSLGGQAANKPLIIGGESVAQDQVKQATVAVYMLFAECTGSFIGNNKIITAAHCISDGAPIAVEFNHPQGAFTCKVLSEVMHPEFVTSQQADWYDIAVLTISCDDARIHQIAPFALATKPAHKNNLHTAGYGRSTENGEFSFPELGFLQQPPLNFQALYLDPQMTAESIAEAKLLEAKTLDDSLTCLAGDRQKTVYFGDSGGPTYYLENEGPVLYAVNASFYSKNTDPDTLFGFCASNIIQHLDWISAQ